MPLISQLHIITDNPSTAEQACRAGAKWIQLRIENQPMEVVQHLASITKNICLQYNAILIIDDFVDIAIETNADGVHLGKSDMPLKDARQLLGDSKIIGATANTFEDIVEIHKCQVDYIGLGPFKFTTTKKNLSPLLGLSGYTELVEKAHACGYHLPLIAIGGIELNDILPLMRTKIHGIALSGAVTQNNEVESNTKQILNALTQHTHE